MAGLGNLVGGSAAVVGIKVVLDADPVGIVKGFAQADTAGKTFAATLQGIQNVGKSVMNTFQGVVAGMERTARRIRNAGIGLGVSLVGATYGAIQLESAMRNVATIDYTVREGFGKTTAQIIAMSRILPQSAKELAEGYYDIASSGFVGAAGQQVLFQSAKAATAGLSTTAEAGRAITSVLNAYGMSANQAAKVSDILFQTVNLGVVTFSELAATTGDYVGMVSQASIPIQDANAALATMTLSGISAAESGTSLNRMVQSLIQPSEALTTAWSRLSSQTLQQAVASRGLHAVMEELRKASGGNISVLLEWFDEIRAARGALALMANEGQTYNRVQEQMKETTGATNDALKQQMQSASMQIKLMINQLKSIGLEIGAVFLPVVKAMAQVVTFMAGAWNVLPGPLKTAIALLGGLSSALMVVVGVLGMFVLKSIAVRAATAGLGKVVQAAGNWVTNFGMRWQASSNSIVLAASRYARAGTLFTNTSNMMGASAQKLQSQKLGLLSVFTRIPGGVRTTGTALTWLTAILARTGLVTERVATMLTRTGSGLQAIARWIPRLAIGLPAAFLGLTVGLGALNQAQQNARMNLAQLTQGFNLNTWSGLERAIAAVRKEQNSSADAMQQYQSVWGTTKGVLQGVGHELLNIVGAGSLLPDVIGKGVANIEATKELNRLVEKQTKLNKISTNVWMQLWRDGARPTAEVYRNLAGQLPHLGKAVNNVSNMLGKDLLNSGRLSREELKMVREEWQNLASAAGGPILNQTGQAIQQSQKQIEQYRKYIEKTVADIVGAFRKDFSIVGAIEHAGAEGEQELRGYLFAQLNTSGRFVEGIQELMRRGLNAETLMEIAMAGPNAAANAIDVLLGKNSEAVIEMVNNATNAMREMRLKLAIEADLIAKAAADPFKAKDMAAAMEMAPIITFLGEAATKERIAQAMGITPEEAGRIATEFGWTLASSIPPALETALNAQMPAVQDHFRLSMQTLVQSTGLTEAQVGEMFVTLIQGGEKAAKELVRTFGLPEHELKLVIDVIDYLARHKITDFGEAVDKLPTHHEVKLATDFGLSLSQLREYKTMWDNLNDKTITLRQYLEIAGMRVADQANIAAMGAAKGGIIKSFARGGEHHVAQMAKGGTWRLWAEPETGGEAYIPLHHGRPTKRDLAILDRVATMFGYATVPMDRGGFYDVRPGRMQSAAGSVVNVSSTVVFSGNIAGHEEFARIARNVVDRRDREVSIALSRKG